MEAAATEAIAAGTAAAISSYAAVPEAEVVQESEAGGSISIAPTAIATSSCA